MAILQLISILIHKHKYCVCISIMHIKDQIFTTFIILTVVYLHLNVFQCLTIEQSKHGSDKNHCLSVTTEKC